ncbi:hypothetical protein F383_38902 [Gossypium arboreum]|uniref:Uncharacterized protein n=1 Tax=Gossypium arboreum TaxID=29729 RepID=A0A0B0MHS8_GOSAR|nr:hypothetical protein F383_38902 [Gossypium arboreum]
MFKLVDRCECFHGTSCKVTIDLTSIDEGHLG